MIAGNADVEGRYDRTHSRRQVIQREDRKDRKINVFFDVRQSGVQGIVLRRQKTMRSVRAFWYAGTPRRKSDQGRLFLLHRRDRRDLRCRKQVTQLSRELTGSRTDADFEADRRKLGNRIAKLISFFETDHRFRSNDPGARSEMRPSRPGIEKNRYRANSLEREHRRVKLNGHRHEENDTISLGDPKLTETAREPSDLVIKRLNRDRLVLKRLRRLSGTQPGFQRCRIDPAKRD